ncbi:MAG: phosphotransferase system cellobiose-specific component [Firmicutes bacterium]|nr:phosphotransferase system cellobiose-specific component [Bacillota bacterium]
MKRITLLCAGGFSTSMLVTRMEEAAQGKGLEVIIRAASESRFVEYENETDILLLGPQVGFLAEDFKKKYTGKGMKVAVIDSLDYGMMNGEKVLKDALDM